MTNIDARSTLPLTLILIPLVFSINQSPRMTSRGVTTTHFAVLAHRTRGVFTVYSREMVMTWKISDPEMLLPTLRVKQMPSPLAMRYTCNLIGTPLLMTLPIPLALLVGTTHLTLLSIPRTRIILMCRVLSLVLPLATRKLQGRLSSPVTPLLCLRQPICRLA